MRSSVPCATATVPLTIARGPGMRCMTRRRCTCWLAASGTRWGSMSSYSICWMDSCLPSCAMLAGRAWCSRATYPSGSVLTASRRGCILSTSISPSVRVLRPMPLARRDRTGASPHTTGRRWLPTATAGGCTACSVWHAILMLIASTMCWDSSVSGPFRGMVPMHVVASSRRPCLSHARRLRPMDFPSVRNMWESFSCPTTTAPSVIIRSSRPGPRLCSVEGSSMPSVASMRTSSITVTTISGTARP